MTIMLYDPVGEVPTPEDTVQGFLDTVRGKRVGYVFNQHTTALHFWNHLELEVKAQLSPSSEFKLYKNNTWRPAPEAEMAKLLKQIDYGLVGVGA